MLNCNLAGVRLFFAMTKAYTYTHNRHMAGSFGLVSTSINLTLADMAFARLFSDRGTLSGGVRRALDQAAPCLALQRFALRSLCQAMTCHFSNGALRHAINQALAQALLRSSILQFSRSR